MEEKEMINFIKELDNEKAKKESMKKITESVDFKFKKIEDVKNNAREICLDKIISDIYKNAVPIDNEVKDVLSDDLDEEFIQFLKAKQPKGTTYYVKEAIKKGSKPAKILLESVNRFLQDYFSEFAININETSADEISFDVEDPDVESKLKEISMNMELDELSDRIKDNVKIATNNEVKRVKDEQQKIKDIEDSMKMNDDIANESAIETELILKGFKSLDKQIYQPSLLEGIMINKLNLIKESGIDLDSVNMNKLAFTESVKEYTKLSVLNSLMLENYQGVNAKNLARKYATMQIKGDMDMLRENRLEMYNNFVVTEGANLDARAEFKAMKKEYKALMSTAKKNIKSNRYDDAIKNVMAVKKLVHQTYDKIDKMESTVGSFVFGLFTREFPFFLRDLAIGVLGSLTFGVASIANQVVKIVERANVIIKDWENRKVKQIELDDVNFYKNALKVRINEYDKMVDKTIKMIKEAKKAIA